MRTIGTHSHTSAATGQFVDITLPSQDNGANFVATVPAGLRSGDDFFATVPVTKQQVLVKVPVGKSGGDKVHVILQGYNNGAPLPPPASSGLAAEKPARFMELAGAMPSGIMGRVGAAPVQGRQQMLAEAVAAAEPAQYAGTKEPVLQAEAQPVAAQHEGKPQVVEMAVPAPQQQLQAQNPAAAAAAPIQHPSGPPAPAPAPAPAAAPPHPPLPPAPAAAAPPQQRPGPPAQAVAAAPPQHPPLPTAPVAAAPPQQPPLPPRPVVAAAAAPPQHPPLPTAPAAAAAPQHPPLPPNPAAAAAPPQRPPLPPQPAAAPQQPLPPAVQAGARRVVGGAPNAPGAEPAGPAAAQGGGEGMPVSKTAQMNLGHRDLEAAFNRAQEISAQQVLPGYVGEAVAAPEASTNKYAVSIFAPLPKDERRQRGIATQWVPGDQAWIIDPAKQRSQNLFRWLHTEGSWEAVDSYNGHKMPSDLDIKRGSFE